MRNIEDYQTFFNLFMLVGTILIVFAFLPSLLSSEQLVPGRQEPTSSLVKHERKVLRLSKVGNCTIIVHVVG